LHFVQLKIHKRQVQEISDSPEEHKFSDFPDILPPQALRDFSSQLPLRTIFTLVHQTLEPITFTMLGFGKKEASARGIDSGSDTQTDLLTEIPEHRWERLWPVMACGAGLFSDGYINNVCTPDRMLDASTDTP
jgi:hypothetical protein